MAKLKNLSDIPSMSDNDLEKFWDERQPEEFEGWQEDDLKFKRPPKKLIQLQKYGLHRNRKLERY